MARFGSWTQFPSHGWLKHEAVRDLVPRPKTSGSAHGAINPITGVPIFLKLCARASRGSKLLRKTIGNPVISVGHIDIMKLRKVIQCYLVLFVDGTFLFNILFIYIYSLCAHISWTVYYCGYQINAKYNIFCRVSWSRFRRGNVYQPLEKTQNRKILLKQW